MDQLNYKIPAVQSLLRRRDGVSLIEFLYDELEKLDKKEEQRIFSDCDPYGEEDWNK